MYRKNVQKRQYCEYPFARSCNNRNNLKLSDLVPVKTFAQGTWGRVDLVHVKNNPDRCFAMKKIMKSRLIQPAARQNVLNEKKILSSVRNDFIVDFHGTFQDKTYLYILMEWCPGGDLSDRSRFDEYTARFYVGCIVEALEYLHQRNIVHRDLKPRNLVVDAKGYLKLIDFGIAKKLGKDERTSTFCGTLRYCAPEMLALRNNSFARGYDVAVDLWMLGLLIYELLVGDHPMSSPNQNIVCKKIMDGMDDVPFPKNVSKDAVDFIKELCDKDPEKRLGYGPGGFDDLRDHSWFCKLDVEELRRKALTPPIVPMLDDVRDTRYFTAHVSLEMTDPLMDLPDYDPNWAKDF